MGYRQTHSIGSLPVTGFLPSLTVFFHFSYFSLTFTRFYRLLLGFTCLPSLSLVLTTVFTFTGFYLVLFKFYPGLLDFTNFY